jgi:uridine kinase
MSEPQASDVARLAGNSLLAGLPIEDIGFLLERLELLDVEPGAVLASSGAPGEGLCFLLDGAARTEGHREGAALSAGDCFGEHTLTRDGRHACTVTATRASRLARLSPEAWDGLAESHPSTALHIARALLRETARHHSAAQRRALAGPAPRRDVRAFVTRAGEASAEVPTGTHVADLVPPTVAGSLVVGAWLDRLAVPLHAPIVANTSLEPLTTRHWEGRDIYRRTASLALLEAAHRIGCEGIRLGPSITTGRVIYTTREEPLPELAARLEAALQQLVREDIPVREEVWKVDEAIAHFQEAGWDDATELLALWHEPTVILVGCGAVLALEPGPTLPRTGLLRDLSVRASAGELVLDFGDVIRRELPAPPRATRGVQLRAPRYGADMTLQKRRWLELLGVTSIGHFGRACVSGRVSQLIHVSEGFHEKRIALIADEVKSRPDVRVIGVAGPSSSGKTTFIKRLKVQLEVNGLDPVELSLDDYYVDRERSPRASDGTLDFEALEALDLPLLQEQLARLLAGEPVATARFDFLSGKSSPNAGPAIQLGKTSVLLLEGIHALNPALLAFAGPIDCFRVFIHPASVLPYDRLSSFEPADVRLLRRIVRDRHGRGAATADSLARWPSVRRGERLHIFPYQELADVVFDSSLVYELSVLRVYAERYLLEVPRSHPEYSAAYRLRRLLQPFVPIHADHVPPTSILREFIGGSGFTG